MLSIVLEMYLGDWEVEKKGICFRLWVFGRFFEEGVDGFNFKRVSRSYLGKGRGYGIWRARLRWTDEII